MTLKRKAKMTIKPKSDLNVMKRLMVVCMGLMLTGCVSTAPFDQHAYETAVDLKVDSLALVDEANEPYKNHGAEAQSILRRIRKAGEYAKWKPHNDETVAQWSRMANPKAHLMAGFIARWKSKGSIKPVMIANIKPGIAAAYNAIIELEAAKIRK